MAFDATEFKIDPLLITEPRARLEYLRDFLRTLPEGRFDMGDPGSCDFTRARGECGSPACIGGWARVLFGKYGDVTSVVHGAFDLSWSVASSITYPDAIMADGRCAFKASPAQAADMITHLLRTGEVDWSQAGPA
jgi:hypothetical protein